MYQSFQSDSSHQKVHVVDMYVAAILIWERPLIIEFCDVTAVHDKTNKQSFIVPWRKHLPLLLAGCWWVFGGQYGNALLMIPFPCLFLVKFSVANYTYLIASNWHYDNIYLILCICHIGHKLQFPKMFGF